MLCKSRSISKEIAILELLHKRMKLTIQEKQHYLSLEKGYEGENLFDSFMEKLQCECLILNDLLLEMNTTTFQIDTLIILQGKIYLYEVKNYKGDYYYQSDKLFKKPRMEVINPLHQLSRSESLLRQLLLSIGFSPQIDASIVFINPNFTLYEAPLDIPVIFPTQINSHIQMLNKTSSIITEGHRKLADKLMEMNINESRFSRVPSYEFEDLQKGIVCWECGALSVVVEKRTCVCERCGFRESVDSAVLRSITEFQTLFPSKKITTNRILDWCRVVKSRKQINRILTTHFTAIGTNKWTYYE